MEDLVFFFSPVAYFKCSYSVPPATVLIGGAPSFPTRVILRGSFPRLYGCSRLVVCIRGKRTPLGFPFQYTCIIPEYFVRNTVRRSLLKTTLLVSHGNTVHALVALSRVHSSAKNSLDLVSSQFREADDLEDTLLPIFIPGRPKRQSLNLVPFGSL